MAEPLCPRASAEVKRGGAFWLRSATTRCNDCHGGRGESKARFRWLPWRERFYGNCISCTRSRRTVNALERRHASLKIESQLSIDEELASIERMEYSGRRLMAARARAPAAHLHTIESAGRSPCG
eukprot:scaffold6529_cov34-Phaeocystis_antarctica.AAC.2